MVPDKVPVGGLDVFGVFISDVGETRGDFLSTALEDAFDDLANQETAFESLKECLGQYDDVSFLELACVRAIMYLRWG